MKTFRLRRTYNLSANQKLRPFCWLSCLAIAMFVESLCCIANCRAQGDPHPPTLQEQINAIAQEENALIESIRSDYPTIKFNTSPRQVYIQAGIALEREKELNQQEEPTVDSLCTGTVSPDALVAARAACDKVLIPFNQKRAQMKSRAQKLNRLMYLQDQLQILKLKRIKLFGDQCPGCGSDDEACWSNCFDGSVRQQPGTYVGNGTPTFGDKAERDRRAIDEYLRSGSIPGGGVKEGAQPPPPNP